ncbi:hypothetical protein [Nocardia sp. CA-145437]
MTKKLTVETAAFSPPGQLSLGGLCLLVYSLVVLMIVSEMIILSH